MDDDETLAHIILNKSFTNTGVHEDLSKIIKSEWSDLRHDKYGAKSNPI